MSSQKVRLAPPALWGVVLSAMVVLLSACSTTPPAALRGSGDLGVVIERADGNVKVIETTGRSVLETVGEMFDAAPYGFAVQKGSGMDKAVQKALQTLMDNGTYLEILTKAGFESGAITEATINAGK